MRAERPLPEGHGVHATVPLEVYHNPLLCRVKFPNCSSNFGPFRWPACLLKRIGDALIFSAYIFAPYGCLQMIPSVIKMEPGRVHGRRQGLLRLCGRKVRTPQGSVPRNTRDPQGYGKCNRKNTACSSGGVSGAGCLEIMRLKGSFPGARHLILCFSAGKGEKVR